MALRILAWILVAGLLVGCSTPKAPPPEPKMADPQQPVKEFALDDFEIRAPFQGGMEIQIQRAFEVESLKAHLDATVKVVAVTPAKLTVDLGAAPEGKVTVRAGAVDLAGYRLARDWTVTLRKPPLPPLVREDVPGGFRVGPYQSLGFRWIDAERLMARFSRPDGSSAAVVGLTGETRPSPVKGTFITEAQVDGKLVSFSSDAEGLWRQDVTGQPVKVASFQPPRGWWDNWGTHIQPGGTAVITYGKFGPGGFLDLFTGNQHKLEAPGFYGSNVFDAWAPDGSLFMVQSLRTDPVPGFYFFDGQGKLHHTWHEAGYFSHWAEWSPDARQIAFLSVPTALKYPRSSEEMWDELPFAPRLGVLDVASGKARYFTTGGLTFYGRLRWSLDSTKIAAGCGELQPGDTAPENPRTCLVDLPTGTARQLTPPSTEYTWITPDRWAPDGSGFLAYVNSESKRVKLAISLRDGSAVELHDSALWVGPDAAVVVLPNTDGTTSLHRADTRGQLGQVLFTGHDIRELALSPDGAHLAFISGHQAHSDDVSTYLVVLRVKP